MTMVWLLQRWAVEFQSTPMTNPGRSSLTWARQVAVEWSSLTVISSPGFRSANAMLPLGVAPQSKAFICCPAS